MRAKIVAMLLAAALPTSPAWAQSAEKRLAAHGRKLLSEQCSRCHQVGTSGPSPHADAPPFRDVMRRYKPEALEEALAEGLSSGHPDMPEFVFEPDDISAILAYLETLRARR